MKQVKWGIIGLGNIASKFAEGFQYTKNAKLFDFLILKLKNSEK